MSERSGVRQICGSSPNFGGELWDGAYPAIAHTILRKTGNSVEIWVESEDVYTAYHADKEVARIKSKKGLPHATKSLIKKCQMV